jgi:hypothetical protein
LNIKTIRKIIDKYEVIKPFINPRKVNLVCDATFFRSRSDKDGLLIFMDAWRGQVLWIKFIESETKKEYEEGLRYLENLNFTIESVTVDGKAGIPSLFSKYPVQVCQFHVQKNILKRTTLKPKSDCGKLLKQIGKEFIKDRWSMEDFKLCYNLVKDDFKDFLSERNDNNQFKHRQLKSAMTGIKRVLPFLFTSQNNPQLRIPNTTNHIDGGINPKLKSIARDHRGMSNPRRNKLMEEMLWSLGQKRSEKHLKIGH